MGCQVIFQHDESLRKWDVIVKNAKNAEDAQHAFTAVAITCSHIRPGLQHRSLVEESPDGFKITPAV